MTLALRRWRAEMTTQAQLINMATRAPQDFRSWAAFVAYTEYL